MIIPVYNEHGILDHCYVELTKSLSFLDGDYELIFVNDGSKDGSREVLESIAGKDARVRVIHLARNFGQQMATTAGIHYAKGKAAVIIDADLQDPPEVIEQMVAKWKQGYEVVYGVRKKRRGDTLLKKITSFCFYRLMAVISETPVPRDTGDFRLMDRRVIDIYKQLDEDPRFFRGLVSWIGFRQIGLAFVRQPRTGGVSKYRYMGLLKLAFDTITSFSTFPALSITLLAASLFSLGVVTTLALFIFSYFDMVQVPTWGWAALALGHLVNLQFICIAILGEYIVRTHRNTQNRPLFVVDTVTESQAQADTKLKTA